MKTATGLTVIAIGAILAFAVTTSPGFLSLHAVGWILMATGGAGILLTPRSQDWLRRRIVIRRTTSPRRPPASSRPRNARQLAPAAPAPAPAPGEQGNYQPEPPRSGPATDADDRDVTRPIEPTDAGGIDDETIEEYVER